MDKAVRDALAASFARVAPQTLAWFDVASPALLADGVLTAEPAALRESFRARVNPILKTARLPSIRLPSRARQ